MQIAMNRAEEILQQIQVDRRDVIQLYWDGGVRKGPHEVKWGFGLTNKPEVRNPAGNVAKRNYKFPMRSIEEARQVFTDICAILHKTELAPLFSTKNVDLSKPLYLKVQVG